MRLAAWRAQDRPALRSHQRSSTRRPESRGRRGWRRSRVRSGSPSGALMRQQRICGVGATSTSRSFRSRSSGRPTSEPGAGELAGNGLRRNWFSSFRIRACAAGACPPKQVPLVTSRAQPYGALHQVAGWMTYISASPHGVMTRSGTTFAYEKSTWWALRSSSVCECRVTRYLFERPECALRRP